MTALAGCWLSGPLRDGYSVLAAAAGVERLRDRLDFVREPGRGVSQVLGMARGGIPHGLASCERAATAQ